MHIMGASQSEQYPPSYQSTHPHSPYIRRGSPPGSPGPRKCCFDGGDTPMTPTTGSSSGDPSMIGGPMKAPAYESGGKANNALFCCCLCLGRGRRKTTSVLTCVGVCFLVVVYTIVGAFTFMAIEGGVHHTTPSSSPHIYPMINDLRSHTVDRLWSITENLNILYRENWTKLAAEEVLEFQEALVRALKREEGLSYIVGASGKGVHHHWTFSSSFLYSLTLITTIGYGNISPRTAWGKLVTIIYALIGIPLMLVYLSTTGDVLARSFRRLYGKMCGVPQKNSGAECPCSVTVKVPITLCLILVLGYICCGAVLFHRLENWTMLEGSYFCFTSLGTIGFGDLIPGQHAEEVSLCACFIYILAGMALVAMCVSLVQEEASSILRLIGACNSKSTIHHPPEQISMSVVGS